MTFFILVKIVQLNCIVTFSSIVCDKKINSCQALTCKCKIFKMHWGGFWYYKNSTKESTSLKSITFLESYCTTKIIVL